MWPCSPAPPWWIFSGAIFERMFNRLRLVRRDRIGRERAWAGVPRAVMIFFASALLLYAGIKFQSPAPLATAAALEPPPPAQALRVAALGEPQALSQLSSLYLQAFDNQPGISLPFASLDYARVTAWLHAALVLDPRAQYPLMMAAQLYGQIDDAPRQRTMCDFVRQAFLAQPNQNWRWLAHCAIMARHRLKDMPLALSYAEDITRHAGKASGWARQMHIFFLEDMGEAERATVLLGGLLAGNEITDAREQRFLMERLEQLKNAGKSAPASKFR